MAGFFAGCHDGCHAGTRQQRVSDRIISVEEVSKEVGCESILSASRMNGAVVISLHKEEKVNAVAESGVVFNDAFVSVLPLIRQARRVVISNVSPFFSDKLLLTELSRYGQVVSQIKKVPHGCKSSLLRHVVCFRHHVFMVLKNGEELNIAFKFRVGDFDFVVFVTTETMTFFVQGVCAADLGAGGGYQGVGAADLGVSAEVEMNTVKPGGSGKGAVGPAAPVRQVSAQGSG